MCNLCSITTDQAAIINLFRVITSANAWGACPDCPAPVVRNVGHARDLGAKFSLARCFSMALQAASASSNVLKGEPTTLIAPRLW